MTEHESKGGNKNRQAGERKAETRNSQSPPDDIQFPNIVIGGGTTRLLMKPELRAPKKRGKKKRGNL